jgi:hypothetical protein
MAFTLEAEFSDAKNNETINGRDFITVPCIKKPYSARQSKALFPNLRR